MVRQTTLTFCFGLIVAAPFLGCGNGNDVSDDAQGNGAVSFKKVESLKTMMQSNPDLAAADLAQIKSASDTYGDANMSQSSVWDGAMNSEVAEVVARVSTKSNDSAKTNNLDPKTAHQAQLLIDEILDEFDLNAQMNAGFLIMGIALNMQKEMFKKFNDESGMGTMKMSDDKFGYKGDHFADKTCDDLVNDPLPGVPKKDLEKTIAKNKENIKASLSGCAKINGNVFVECISDLNHVVSIVNQHATCSMTNFDELTKITEEKMGRSMQEIQASGEKCEKVHFAKCGYVEQEARAEWE